MFLSPFLSPTSDMNDLWYSGQKFNNPRIMLDHCLKNARRISLNNSAFVEVTPVKGLKLRSQFTYYSYQRHGRYYEPGYLPAKKENEGGYASRDEYDDTSFSSENTVYYELRPKSGHNFDVLGGYTAQIKYDNNLSITGRGYTLDELTWNNMAAVPDKQNTSISTNHTDWTKMSVFGRLNYNYKERYYVTFTARYDGASNFAANKKWGFFPSAALRWNIANEKFLQKSQVDRRTGPARQPRTHRQRRHLGLPFAGGRRQLDERLPDGRHAAAGGLPVASGITRPDVGNLRPVYPRSRHLAVRRTAQRHGRRLSDQDPRPAADRTGSLADGLHQLLRQRRTHHQQGVGTHRRKPQHRPSEIPVVDDPHPVAQQADGGRHRLGRLRDSLLVAVVVGNHLHDVRLQEGLHAQRPLGIPLRRRMAQPGRGRAQQDHQAYASASGNTFKPGYARYQDINHDGALNSDDLVYLGSADPDLYGGIQNTFNIHNFTFSFFFNYSIGGKIYNVAELWMGNGSPYTNQYKYMQNSWHPVRNPNSNLPMAGSYDALPSDRLVHDASYLRLKNISASYTFDMRKVTKNRLRDIRVSVSGENLYLWKKYNGFDPDVSTSSSNSALRRVDIGAYPKPRPLFSASRSDTNSQDHEIIQFPEKKYLLGSHGNRRPAVQRRATWTNTPHRS